MPGTRCSVNVCNNSRFKTRICNPTITYHRFPKDPLIRNQWMLSCDRTGKWNPDTSSICSNHFVPDDYERDLQNELLGLPLIKRLKRSAIPSDNLSIENIKVKKEKAYVRKSTSRKLSKTQIKADETIIEQLNEQIVKEEIMEELNENVPINCNDQSDNQFHSDDESLQTMELIPEQEFVSRHLYDELCNEYHDLLVAYQSLEKKFLHLEKSKNKKGKLKVCKDKSKVKSITKKG